MKRTIICVLGLAALAGAYLGSGVLAQPSGSMGPAATKVGLVNIGTIFKDYYKVQLFRKQFEEELKPFKEEEKRLTDIGIQWEKALKGGQLDEANKAKGIQTLKEVRRRLEDLQDQYKKKVAKKTEEQLVQLYKEVNDAIGSYASSQGYHLILGFGEPADANLMTFVNITRKMQAMDQGGTIPMYFSTSIDISQPVLSILNGPGRNGGGVQPVGH